MTPTVVNTTVAPAITTPVKMRGMALRDGMPNTYATNDAVQTPVIGKGTATSTTSANSLNISNFFSWLFLVLSKKREKTFSQRSDFPERKAPIRPIKGTRMKAGMILPTTATEKAVQAEKS